MEAHEIIYLVLAVLGLLFGGAFWRKFDTAVKLLAELAELLQAVSELMATTFLLAIQTASGFLSIIPNYG